MAYVTKDFENALKSVLEPKPLTEETEEQLEVEEELVVDEFEGLTEEQLEEVIESFESKLEKARAKLAKKPKDDYDFTGFKDADDRRKEAGGIKVSGSYGKTYQGDADDLDAPKGTVKGTQPEAVKRGRGRPRGSKNR